MFRLPCLESIVDPARARAEPGSFEIDRFANGELVGSVSPPEARLAGFLLAADTLKRHGAAHVRGVLPFMAYARQDHPEPQASLACAWLGALLGASGVDELVTIDVHSDDAVALMPMPVVSIAPAHLGISGELRPHAVIVDDILDTGPPWSRAVTSCTAAGRTRSTSRSPTAGSRARPGASSWASCVRSM